MLDAVWSIGVRYRGAENVVSAYRGLRGGEGGRPERGTVDDLAAAIDDAGGPAALEEAKSRWLAVPGQRSSLSWRYLLLLAGRQKVKPDRMLIRFVGVTLGRSPSAETTAALVLATASALGAKGRVLDHRIWRFQSGRG